jgi:hypothetical protein
VDGILERIGRAELRQLYAHWDALRGERFAPARRDLDPTRIPRLLPCLVLVEPLEARRLRYRLAGTDVEHFFGGRMTGRCLDELASGEYLRFIEGLYHTVIERRVPVYAENTYTERGLATSRLMLPLSSDGARVDMILAGQVFARSRPPLTPLAAGHGPITDVDVVVGSAP